MFHFESKTVALLVSFALFKSGLDLWCRNLFGHLRHHVIETRPAGIGDFHTVINFPR